MAVDTPPVVTRVAGYLYSKKTAPGFQRMKRQGIPMPPFRIEEDVTKLLTGHYDRLISKLSQAIKSVAMMEKATTDSRMTTDGFYQEIMGQMQDVLLRSVGSDKEKLAERLAQFLKASEDHFFENFLDDADGTVKIRVQFALDKDEVFRQRIDYLMGNYLSSALDRIETEENHLKSAFLKNLTEYALGKVPDLESIRDVMAEMRETSVREARYFARNQFALLNKSLTLASFDAADVQRVQWWTVQDGRVRPTHKAVNKKVFPVDDLPRNDKGYFLHEEPNCRCSFTPVWSD